MAVFSASCHCRRPGHLRRVRNTHLLLLALASLPPVFFPNEPAKCLRQIAAYHISRLLWLRGGKKSLYHGAFTHISHSLNPFSNLLMRVTWQYQRRFVEVTVREFDARSLVTVILARSCHSARCALRGRWQEQYRQAARMSYRALIPDTGVWMQSCQFTLQKYSCTFCSGLWKQSSIK